MGLGGQIHGCGGQRSTWKVGMEGNGGVNHEPTRGNVVVRSLPASNPRHNQVLRGVVARHGGGVGVVPSRW